MGVGAFDAEYTELQIVQNFDSLKVKEQTPRCAGGLFGPLYLTTVS